VAIWYALAIIYFAAHGRKTLVYSPEEEFAVKQREGSSIDESRRCLAKYGPPPELR
jgi:hypothetical protein